MYIYILYISGENRVPGYPRIPGSITILQVSTHVIFSWTKTSKLLRLDKVVRYLPLKPTKS